jgi:hypothetical protein
MIGLGGGIPAGYGVALILRKVFLDVNPPPDLSRLLAVYRRAEIDNKLSLATREALDKLRS